MEKKVVSRNKNAVDVKQQKEHKLTDLKSVDRREVNWETFSNGVTENKYYAITEFGEVIINHNTAKADRSQDGRVILVPRDCEDYFYEDEFGKKSLNKELAGYEITVGGEVVVVPNKPLMRNFELFV